MDLLSTVEYELEAKIISKIKDKHNRKNPSGNNQGQEDNIEIIKDENYPLNKKSNTENEEQSDKEESDELNIHDSEGQIPIAKSIYY